MKGLFDQQGAGVVIQDDDVKGVEISPKNLTIAEGDTGGATYTVVLDSEPTSAVTVTISGHAGTDLTLDTDHPHLHHDDWDTPQTVTVTAARTTTTLWTTRRRCHPPLQAVTSEDVTQPTVDPDHHGRRHSGGDDRAD